jgi:hypothetical protein
MPNSPINLTLMIGPAVPIPVSQEVLDALTSVTVTTNSDTGSGFQLQFTLSNRSLLQTVFLLSSGLPIPLVRVVIIVTVNGRAEVLMDGVMTNHEVSPGTDASHSVLTVTGEDLSRVMDYVDFSGTPFPGMPPEARVLLILLKYAVFGIRPLVIPSVLIDIPIPTEEIPAQKGKDLCYIRTLADDVGYVFYVEPGPKPLRSIAYWGPEIKVGVPQKALNINMDSETNIENVSRCAGADSHYENLNPDSDSRYHAAQPASRPHPRSAAVEPCTDRQFRKVQAGSRGDHCPDESRPIGRIGHRHWFPGCNALRRSTQSASSRWIAWRRRSFRRPLLCQERHQQNQTRRI